MPMRSHRAVPGIELARVLSPRLLHLGRENTWCQLSGDGSRYLILNGEYIGDFPVVAVRPQVMPAGGFDQLGGDPYPVAGPANASFKDVANAEVAPYLTDIDSRTLV